MLQRKEAEVGEVGDIDAALRADTENATHQCPASEVRREIRGIGGRSQGEGGARRSAAKAA
jgi:hypothetical protein